MIKRHVTNFPLSGFQNVYLVDKKFNRLYAEWVKSGYNKQLKPSIDRIDSKKVYDFENIHFLTWAENRYKQSAMDGKRGRKPAVIQMMGNKIIKRFLSQRHAVKELGLSQGDLSMVLNGKRKTVDGYKFIYENPELLSNPDALTANNPERVQWKSVMTMLMNQKGKATRSVLS